MPITSRRAFCVSSLAAVSFLNPPRVLAQASSNLSAAIGMAGRQRMLTQRMVMAACFMKLGIEETAHLEILSDANDLFASSLVTLRRGDSDLGIPASSDEDVLAALDVMDATWETLGPRVSEVIDRGAATKNDIGLLAVVEEEARQQSDDIVTAIVKLAGGGSDSAAINIAGRQRMLTQKMAKEAALVALEYQQRENASNLGATAALFGSSLNALINSDSSLRLRPVPPVVADQLEKGRLIWDELSIACNDIADIGEATIFDLELIAELRDELLAKMQAVVTLLERG